MIKYHDLEWGKPLHNDRKLFEYLVLDAFQAGLSWSTIINKRKNFEVAFDKFDFRKIAHFNKRKVVKLLNDPGIIRNKLKILSTIDNAQAFIRVQKEFGSFDKYIWRFVDYRPVVNKWKQLKDLPARTHLSDAMSKDLKSRGFKFVGSTICYAFMQAAGLVNDHVVYCFRHKQLKRRV